MAALALWSCGGSGGSSSPTAPSPPAVNQPAPSPSTQTVTVNIVGSIGNTAFSPNPVAATPGVTVVFRNNDAVLHRIVLDDGSADLGDVAPGGSSRGFAVTSASPLTFHCTNHPSMVGSINGATAPEPPPCNDPYGYGC
jgi:plastocyanin